MLSPSSTLKLSIPTTGYSSVFCNTRRIQSNYFCKQHKLGFLQLRQEIRNMNCILRCNHKPTLKSVYKILDIKTNKCIAFTE